MRRTLLALAIELAVLSGVPDPVKAQTPASEEARSAVASVFVFAESKALAGVTVEADGAARGVTDAHGGLAFRLAPGKHDLKLLHKDKSVLELKLDTDSGEQVQVAVSLFPDRAPVYRLESSLHGERTVDTTPKVALAVLSGRVVNTATRAPVSGAALVVNGQAYQADATGRFNIEVRAGETSVYVSADGFRAESIPALELKPGAAQPREFALAPEGMAPARGPLAEEGAADTAQLEAVTVEGTVSSEDQASFVEERRSSTNVTEVLSAEQIARSGDSDAAAALKRVTGVTLVNDRFVYVRGLGERYSSVLLNGAQIPSPDPTRRVVPLDLFPTEILEGMVVQKTYSADMPGEFGGGTVSMRTKRFPSSFYYKVSGTLGAGNTTFEDGLRYDGGDRDWIGEDDGTRAIPDSLAAELDENGFLRQQSPLIPNGATPQEIEVFGEELADVFDVESEDIGPNTGFAGVIGNSWAFNDDIRGGVMASVRYAQEWDNRDEFRQTFVPTDAGLERQDFFDVDRTIRTIDGSLFVTSGLEFGSNHFLRHTSMLVRQTEDETKVSTGTEVNEETQITELEWIENSLLAHQLGGEHYFPGAHDLSFNWLYTHAKAERDVPNKRRYRYDVIVDENGDETLQFSQRADNLAIVFEDLEDNSDTLDLKLGLPLTLSDSFTLQLAAGATLLERDRESQIRRFGFQSPQPGGGVPPEVFELPSLEDILSDQNIAPQGFRLFEGTRATDNYFADQSLDAYFLTGELAYTDKFRAVLGARHESNQQNVTTFSISSATAQPVVTNIDEDDLLPAMNLTWFVSPESQVRFGYSETLSRPDFRELSPAPYTDPEQDAEVLGNPDLVTTQLKNYDLRYEYYFSPTESVSAGVFLKDFENPIEVLRIPVATVLLTLDNALEARNYGFELDYFASLAIFEEGGYANRLGIDDWLDWENFYLGLNYAYIESDVELDPETSASQTNQNRPLQGQSPYVTNLQLGYLSPDGERELTLSYNRFGERIAQVGIAGAPDIYERPVNQLDFVWQEQLGKDWRIKFRARNLLDPEVRYVQGDETNREFKRGRELFITLEWAPE